MQEIVFSRRTSVSVGLVLTLISAYCLQYAILPTPFVFPLVYGAALGLLVLLWTIHYYGDARFEGILANRPHRAIWFWLSIALITLAYSCRVLWGGEGQIRDGVLAHFVVGAYLYSFALSAILGSYFFGLGLYLFLKSPFLGLRYLVMKRRGELD